MNDHESSELRAHADFRAFADWAAEVRREHDGLPPFMVDGAHLTRFLSEYSILILKHNQDLVREAIRVFARPENYPIAFGCFTGKDRTGIIGALLLGVLGATREEIVADYELSNEAVDQHLRLSDFRREQQRREQPGYVPPPQMVAATEEQRRLGMSVHPSVIGNTFDWLEEHFGSVVGYLRSIGVEQAELRAIRDAIGSRPGAGIPTAGAARL